MIRTAIVEDNINYLESLKAVLQSADDLEFVAGFGSAEGFLESHRGSGNFNADVLILDLQLPGQDGLSLLPAVKELYPKTEVLVITQKNDYHATLEAIRLGTSGYILKNSPVTMIRSAIREVAAGGSVFDPHLCKLVLQALTEPIDTENDDNLSKREIEVLQLMSQGYAKKEVAHTLNISYGSVAQATNSIYKKLKVPNITAAVTHCLRKGVI